MFLKLSVVSKYFNSNSKRHCQVFVPKDSVDNTSVLFKWCNYFSMLGFKLIHVLCLASYVAKTWTVLPDSDDWNHYINGLVQDCSISSANALEILQSCTMPLLSFHQNKAHVYKIWVSKSREHHKFRSENEIYIKKKNFPFWHSYNTFFFINVKIFIQDQNFYFNNWSYLRKKACESCSICFPENKNAKMVQRTKWSQSCAWRKKKIRQPV